MTQINNFIGLLTGLDALLQYNTKITAFSIAVIDCCEVVESKSKIMKIYQSWQVCLARRLYIEETFHTDTFEKNLYDAVLKTMRYISSYIKYDKSLKDDLHQVRAYYLEEDFVVRMNMLDQCRSKASSNKKTIKSNTAN